MAGFWQFATTSPGYAFLVVLVVCYAATRPFKYACLAYSRHLRSRNIAAQGWPTPPLDADGDIVHPPKDEAAE